MAAPGLDYSQFEILVVDDERDNLDTFRFNFQRMFKLHLAQSGAEALEILKNNDIAVVVTDQRMPQMTGLELLRQVRTSDPEIVGIIVTAFTDTEVLIEAINLGQIYRYITKPWDREELRGILRQAVERFHMVRENRRLEEQLQSYAGMLSQEAHGKYNFGAIIGDSSALREVLDKVEQVAPTTSTVFLNGETGTGKELVARAIHINSPRENRPFVRVNCAALASGVLESELFGHEKGAFTGAVSRRAGRFEMAHGGTIFLDEVGDLPADVQVKLLRVLQEREFERVGGVQTVKVDVRVVSATHQDLEALIAAGKFREDLYYRLNVFSITLPPLRQRPEDLPLLVEHFLQKFVDATGKRLSGIDGDALQRLAAYPWPGNVRELENVIERALILARGETLSVGDLDFGRRLGANAATPSPIATTSAPSDPRARPSPQAIAVVPSPGGPQQPFYKRVSEQEQQEIVSAVEQCQGNIAQAARALGINRSTLYYRMKKHGLDHMLPTK